MLSACAQNASVATDTMPLKAWCMSSVAFAKLGLDSRSYLYSREINVRVAGGGSNSLTLLRSRSPEDRLPTWPTAPRPSCAWLLREAFSRLALTLPNCLASNRFTSAFESDSNTSAGKSSTTVSAVSAPYWVKLVRSGNTFTAYRSSDGVNWQSVGSETINMGGSVWVGLVLTNQSTSSQCTATFDNFSAAGPQ